MTYRYLDYETRGLLNLPSVGHHEYLQSAEILCVGDGGSRDAISVNPKVGEILPSEVPVSWGNFDLKVYLALENPTFPRDRWIDAQALAFYLGFPAGLNAFCKAVGFEAKKDARGTRLINKYCSPNDSGDFPEIPEDDWLAFQEYCRKDTELLARAWEQALEQFYGAWSDQWRANYELVERMNDRGVPIDRASAEKALRLARARQEELREECWSILGCNPTQTEKLRVFLGTENMTAPLLESITFDDPKKERIRQIRLQTNKAAIQKLPSMLSMSASDGRVRGCFVSNGAHTGRGASRTPQFHNMIKEKVDASFFQDMDAVADPISGAQRNIRGFLQAPEGRVFAIADYAQMEARIIAWLAREETLLGAFASPDRDVYCEFASGLYGREIVKGVDDEERSLGKLGILGSGFGVSGPGLARQAPDYGIDLSDERGWEVVNQYDSDFPGVGTFRQRLIEGAVRCIRSRGHAESVGEIGLSTSGDFLVVRLPSGRELRYWKPVATGKDRFEFMRRSGATMFRKRMWHGYLTENVVQAIGADIKLDAMRRLEEVYGAELILEIHDEIVVEVNEREADTMLQAMLGAMRHPPKYVPEGLMEAEGGLSRRYTKL